MSKKRSKDPRIIHDSDATLRYDSIRISQLQNGIAGVEFLWQESVVHTITPTCNFAFGDTLTLVGMDGEMPTQPRT